MPRAAPGARRLPARRRRQTRELVPAEAQEVLHRRRRPRAVGERGALPGWLAQEDAANECCEVVEHINVRVHHHAGAQRVQRRECPARERA